MRPCRRSTANGSGRQRSRPEGSPNRLPGDGEAARANHDRTGRSREARVMWGNFDRSGSEPLKRKRRPDPDGASKLRSTSRRRVADLTDRGKGSRWRRSFGPRGCPRGGRHEHHHERLAEARKNTLRGFCTMTLSPSGIVIHAAHGSHVEYVRIEQWEVCNSVCAGLHLKVRDRRAAPRG
jgi:hypothetical protein